MKRLDIKELSAEEHAALLHEIGSMPFSNVQAKKLAVDLQSALLHYHELLYDLDETVKTYIETAKKVRDLKRE